MKPIKKYEEYAPCGFCKFYGRKFTSSEENICFDCEVRRIREAVEEIASRNKFEHDHKYRADDDGEIRNCAHCEHALIYETRYPRAEWHTDNGVWCSLEEETSEAKHKPSDCCEKWQRATDKNIRYDRKSSVSEATM